MYESFFGLTGPPFRLTPDPSFLFDGKGHREASAALRVGLAAGARVLVLTGEVGAGKTTLLQALMASVDRASTLTTHLSAAHLDAEMLIEQLSEAWGLPRQPDPLARRDAVLTALASGSQATLLVIDEAQHLGPSALDLLAILAAATAPSAARLQIFLVGQPELRILLNTAQRSGFRKLIGVDRHLGPLEPAETRLYIEHRLHRAGWTGKPEFEDEAFSEIFIFTAGNPRRVNLLCDSLMLCACLKKQQRIDAPAVTWAAAAMREDSSRGTPDLLDLGSHFERRPTLTEAFEPDIHELEAAIGSEESESARPTLDGVAEPSAEMSRAPEDTVTAPDAAPVETVSEHAANGLPLPTITDGTPPQAEPAQSDPRDAPVAELVARQASAARRRRQAILASAAAVGVALALSAYVLYREVFDPSLSQTTSHDIVANRMTTRGSPAPGVDTQRRAGGSISPASSGESSADPRSPDVPGRARAIDAAAAKTPQDGVDERGGVADAVPGAASTAPAPVPTGPAPTGTQTPPCDGPAFALGLCDAGSSSLRRQ
jgi:type II secretory pathway predicted ATPase ExeA